MKHYTIGEFRKRIKEALDFADLEDGEVVLHRYGRVYILKVPLNPSLYVDPKTAPLKLETSNVI